jgi:hypothetical protein
MEPARGIRRLTLRAEGGRFSGAPEARRAGTTQQPNGCEKKIPGKAWPLGRGIAVPDGMVGSMNFK